MFSFPNQHPSPRARWFTLAAAASALLANSASWALAAPSLPALTNSKLEPEWKGVVLAEELNCVACHGSEGSLKDHSKKAPRLADVGKRVNPAFIEAFIKNPAATKPGTTMPDVFSSLNPNEKQSAAKALTHFLLSLRTSDFALQAPDPVAAKLGKQLFHSRGCAACHSPRDEKGAELLPASSVPLGALEKKYSHSSLVQFLRQPHASRPSGRMPDLRLPAQELERIAHFLLQDTRVPGAMAYTLYRGQVWEGLESEKVTPVRAGHVKDFAAENLGKLEQHSAVRYAGWLNIVTKGQYRFFLTMNGGSLEIDGKRIVALDPSDRRGTKDMEGGMELEPGWHPVALTYFHTGRQPRFSCEIEGPGLPRQAVPGSMLSVSKEPIAPLPPFVVDAAEASRGRALFESAGCANCHDDLGIAGKPATAFAKLDATRGCLGKPGENAPQFGLSPEQKEWLGKALPLATKPAPTDDQQIRKTLVTFNCIACHERTGLGGISQERNPLFTGTQPALGDQGRIPPPLSHVGAKLTPGWLADVLLHGKRQRDYVDAAMPQFGEANVGQLVELFGKVDRLEEAVLPKVANIQESKAAGYEMVGANGLSCIACHEFNGQKSGEVSAVDITRVPERLKKNWFALYMRQPSRFHPTVIMPSFWPDGQSTRPAILGGDTAQQIEALWAYLEDGPRARKPAGLSRQSNELRVGDVAEICRGRGPAGYRGIGVGYPERINLAFDSGEMALRQLWKGDFASVDAGSFSVRGTDPVVLPPGIPFHRLQSLEENWPYKGKTNHAFPQDHGYEFRGYRLDAKRRPTFAYRYGDIAVEDFFEDVRDAAGNAFFKRTLRFDSPGEQPAFYFRAAAGKGVAKKGERTFGIGGLNLRITSAHTGLVREGDTGDVLIPLTLPKGTTTLTLEYQW